VADQENSPGPGSGKAGGTLLLRAWRVVVLGVPSAVAAVKWRAIGAHPVLAVLVLLVAAVLAAAGWLVRELWRRAYRERLLDWIIASVDRRTARFARRYREHLMAELWNTDLRGLDGLVYSPEFSEVYVDVALRPRDPGTVPPSDLTADDLDDLPVQGQRRLLSDFLGRPRPRVLAVIGAPGSGKTALLRHTASQLCGRRWGQRRKIPVLLYLRDHAEAIAADPHVALSALFAAAVLDRYGLAEVPGWMDGRLRARKCVVLLDGLDEVACQEDRLKVSEWVSKLVARYPGNEFVVTSRPLGYNSAPVEAWITVQTQPFTAEQVSRFVRGWYLAMERHSTSRAGPADISGSAGEKADDLLFRLRDSEALRELTVNPLLLTMTATLHRDGRDKGALPERRAELYAQICRVLLWRRQAAKKLAVEPDGLRKERIMRLVAFEMMRSQVRDLSTDDAVAIVRRGIGEELAVDARGFLDDVAANGLFVDRGNGDRTFAHSTFQEYLAAAHIKDENLQEVLTRAVGDIWWREATLLYAAMADAAPIVQACLAANTVPALALAFDCAEEADLPEDLRGRLEHIRASGLSLDDPQRRKLMTGVTITRQLRPIIYGDGGARICARPVTTGIYQYFLDDMAARGQHRPPDAPPAAGNGVATGMRDSDAAAFADWVDDITGGRTVYRLPTRDEIQDPAIRSALTGQPDMLTHHIWLSSGEPGKSPLLLHSRGTARSPTIHGTDVQQRSRTDFRDAYLSSTLLPLITPLNTTSNDARQTLLASILYFARHLANDLLDIDIDSQIAEGLLFLRDRALTVARAIPLDFNLDFTRDRTFAPARDHTRDHALDLVRDLELALALAEAVLEGTVKRARSLDLDLVRGLALGHAPGNYLGHALSQMLSAAFSGTAANRQSATQVREMLANRLCDASGIGSREYVVSPDLLTALVTSAISEARTRLPGMNRSPHRWIIQVTTNLEALAEGILARRQPVTAPIASACRITALCLAAEADCCKASNLSDTFRQIAAGITWLERRHNGDEPPSEIIVLALN
jgi:NACHT domain